VTRGSSIGLAVAERFAAEGATAAFATLDEITPEHFDQIFSVNVRGTPFTVQKRCRCSTRAPPSTQ
jgi:NAD(P)-dependent dehydrogenase (short-subunit alcohol dehydrogenase family)